jgi:four helix bundle protein
MNEKIKTYRDLIVWQKSMKLVKSIYSITRNFPTDEKFGLVSQIRRCAVSIPSNIAEGYGRWTGGEYQHFLRIAFGSLCELQTQLEIALDLGFTEQNSFDAIYNDSKEVERLFSSLLSKLHTSMVSEESEEYLLTKE